mmetsp:Transcript_18163/g.37033  ORF Transcript_18163/g.37033 Transcript_18163/m.37033 type:complete len:420 (+) Transcript_18163:1349-2608(+)
MRPFPLASRSASPTAPNSASPSTAFAAGWRSTTISRGTARASSAPKRFPSPGICEPRFTTLWAAGPTKPWIVGTSSSVTTAIRTSVHTRSARRRVGGRREYLESNTNRSWKSKRSTIPKGSSGAGIASETRSSRGKGKGLSSKKTTKLSPLFFLSLFHRLQPSLPSPPPRNFRLVLHRLRARHELHLLERLRIIFHALDDRDEVEDLDVRFAIDLGLGPCGLEVGQAEEEKGLSLLRRQALNGEDWDADLGRRLRSLLLGGGLLLLDSPGLPLVPPTSDELVLHNLNLPLCLADTPRGEVLRSRLPQRLLHRRHHDVHRLPPAGHGGQLQELLRHGVRVGGVEEVKSSRDTGLAVDHEGAAPARANHEHGDTGGLLERRGAGGGGKGRALLDHVGGQGRGHGLTRSSCNLGSRGGSLGG